MVSLATGQRLPVPMGARSGSWGVSSVYDDFGSTDGPISFDFGQYGETEVAVFVGREQPRPGAGPLSAVLTAYGWLRDGTVGEVARASRVLEEAAIPTTRCLHVTAPTGTTIRGVSIEYYDQDGNSAYERRWVDDLVLRGAIIGGTPRQSGARGTVSIVEPVDQSVVLQLATRPIHVIADVHWYDTSLPNAEAYVNRSRASNAVVTLPIRRAADGDPTHWVVEGDVARGLVLDEPNEIAVVISYRMDVTDTASVLIQPPVAGNLRVAGIEVNQAIQEPGYRIPLIGEKPTVVRVFVQGTPDARGPWGQVTGQLITRTRDGVMRTHNPIGPTTPLPGPISTFTRDSQLIFLLDRAETVAGSLSITASLRPVDPRPQTNLGDDRSTISVTFSRPIYYVFYGILFSTPDGQTNPWSKLEDYTRYLAHVFPVTAATVIPVPGLGQTPQPVDDIHQLRIVTGVWASRLGLSHSVYGLWAGEGIMPGLCGFAQECEGGMAVGRRTDGNGSADDGPPTMAQELAHSEGLLWHADGPLDPAATAFRFLNPLWPWYRVSIGHPGIDTRDPVHPVVINPFVVTNLVHDFMSYTHGPRWVSPYTYCALLDSLGRGEVRCPAGASTAPSQEFVAGTTPPSGQVSRTIAALTAAESATPAPGSETEYLIIQGEIAWDAQSATLSPVEKLSRSEPPAIETSGDAFTLEIRDAAGGVLASIPFTPEPTHYDEGEPVPFMLSVPNPPGAAAVLIMRGDQVLARRDASANAPVVSITSAPSGTISAATDLTWSASDADGDPMTYVVEVSYDNRASWLPIAVALDQPSLHVDPAWLKGSSAAWLRVEASDGFNSTAVETGPFAIATHAPMVTLDSATHNVTVSQGAPVFLRVDAEDLEDGSVDPESISWASDKDGALGVGDWIVVESLTPGTHLVTATATDSDGQTGQVSLTVNVTASGATEPPGVVATSVPTETDVAVPLASSAPSAPPAESPATTSGGSMPLILIALVAIGAVSGGLFTFGYRRRNRIIRP